VAPRRLDFLQQNQYEDRYRDVVKVVGLDLQKICKYVWVARHVEPPQRRQELSFQHHVEVASLPPDEQDAWLDRAS
jgi:hypothetical protein